MALNEILLVEDDPEDVSLLTDALKWAGCDARVVVARDGKEALDYLFGEAASGKRRDPPALVVLDWVLPGLNGLEILNRIRTGTHLNSLIIVMLTTAGGEEWKREAEMRGANFFFQKPAGLEALRQLAARIKDLLPAVADQRDPC